MQQRKLVYGRPSGTDGSDYSYRMLIDPRFTKVAQGKSRLYRLIVAQVRSPFPNSFNQLHDKTISHVLGVLWTFVVASQGKGLNELATYSIIIGSLSLIIGELGRRRSSANLLRLYIAASTIASIFSVGRIVNGYLSFKVARDWSGSMLAKLEMVEDGRVLLGVTVQIFAVVTSVSLLRNMSLKRVS